MNDFITPQITSTIYCDTEGCDQRIVVPCALDEHEAAAVARAANWSARMGALRFYHACPKHGWTKR